MALITLDGDHPGNDQTYGFGNKGSVRRSRSARSKMRVQFTGVTTSQINLLHPPRPLVNCRTPITADYDELIRRSDAPFVIRCSGGILALPTATGAIRLALKGKPGHYPSGAQRCHSADVSTAILLVMTEATQYRVRPVTLATGTCSQVYSMQRCYRRALL